MRSTKHLGLAGLLVLAPALAPAQSPAAYPAGTPVAVNVGAGDQKEPHVSGDLVAYSSELDGAGEIRVFSLATREDRAIPGAGGFDYLSDVSGDSVVFTRIAQDRSAILRFDVRAGGAPVELAPAEGSNRRAAAVGNRTVAWEDYGRWGTQGAAPELVVHDLDSGALQALSADALHDTHPAVSPDGQSVVWTKCEGVQGRCDVWQAQAGPAGFVAQALTSGPESAGNPDTNGALVVYDSARMAADGSIDHDLFLQPVGGGTELRLGLPGQDLNPSISGRFIAFQRRFPGASPANSDIALYDLTSRTLHRLTETPEDEQLTDVWISPDAQRVNVVWSVREDGDDNVRALVFQTQQGPCTPGAPESPEAVCASPGARALLAELRVQRARGSPSSVTEHYSATGTGVLCVDNGAGDGEPATAGWVSVNGQRVLKPDAFGQGVASIAQAQELSSTGSVSASIAGKPGTAYRVRLYGAAPACALNAGRPLPAGGEHVVPVAARGAEVRAPQRRSGAPGDVAGCSSTGPGTALAALLLLAAALLRERRVRVPVRRP